MERSFYTRLVYRDRERDRRSSSQTIDRDREHALVCAACGHRISDDDHRIEMSGAHEHTFVNPAGYNPPEPAGFIQYTVPSITPLLKLSHPSIAPWPE